MRQNAFVTLLDPSFSPFRFYQDWEKDFEKMLTDNSEHYFEQDGHYLTSMDMPGVDGKDINIEIEENKVFVSAERKLQFGKNNQVIKYQRVFAIPKHTDVEKIDAHYENGVLTLAFPKMEENKYKKKIQVVTGEKPSKWQSLLNFARSEKNEAAEKKMIN